MLARLSSYDVSWGDSVSSKSSLSSSSSYKSLGSLIFSRVVEPDAEPPPRFSVSTYKFFLIPDDLESLLFELEIFYLSASFSLWIDAFKASFSSLALHSAM